MEGCTNTIEKLTKELSSLSINGRTSLVHGSLTDLDINIENCDEQKKIIIGNLHETKKLIDDQIEYIEKVDLILEAITFKTFSLQHELRQKVDVIQDKITKIQQDDSDNVEGLINLEREIETLEKECLNEIENLNTQKLNYQQKFENTLEVLEKNLKALKMEYFKLIQIKEIKLKKKIKVNHETQKQIDNYKEIIKNYEKLQETNWIPVTLETKVSRNLETVGLKITKDGLFLTSSGKILTFDEVKNQHYLDNISISWESLFKKRILNKVKRESKEPISLTLETSSTTTTSDSYTYTELPSEDVNYLKDNLGKPLTMALAEIISVQPKDPIHYLGHWLFKYRYNQETDQLQQIEIDALTQERNRIAREKWEQFLQKEAYNAVIDMIFNAEEDAIKRELKRIEMEMLKTTEEGEYEEFQI